MPRSILLNLFSLILPLIVLVLVPMWLEPRLHSLFYAGDVPPPSRGAVSLRRARA
jgi:hypothetical protein